MPNAVLVDVVRTPMGRGKPDGLLSDVHPVELLATTFAALVERSGIDPGSVQDVLVGCVSQAGEQSGTPGRWAWLAAGYPEHVPAVTIERKCGSSQQAIDFAAQGILAGVHDLVIAAGVESMSRIPMGSARGDSDPFGPSARSRFAPGPVPQGVAAELVAARWGISRQRLDDYAARSHQRAAATADSGGFDSEIIPVPRTDPGGDGHPAATDETIRRGTTPSVLATLQPAFENPQLLERFPEINWSITAGNSSQITDGASAALLMSEERARELGLVGRARVVEMAVAAADPIEMLTGPIPATEKVLAHAGLTADDIDMFEVNEAFASVPLAWQEHFKVDDERLNPRGGAIALGHPLGASGCRLMTSLVNGLEEQDGRFGLQVMCEAGGMANATVIERLGTD